jgi:hypothetical protein
MIGTYNPPTTTEAEIKRSDDSRQLQPEPAVNGGNP